MIRFYGIDYKLNFKGVVQEFGENMLGAILVVYDVIKDTRRFLNVSEHSIMLSRSDLELRFKIGDSMSISNGMLITNIPEQQEEGAEEEKYE